MHYLYIKAPYKSTTTICISKGNFGEDILTVIVTKFWTWFVKWSWSNIILQFLNYISLVLKVQHRQLVDSVVNPTTLEDKAYFYVVVYQRIFIEK